MNFSEMIEKIKTIFLDTAPIIYFIEAHDQFGPVVRQLIELMNGNMIRAFMSVLTLSEVLPKPVETGNDELVEKFKMYLKNGPNLTMLPITETIGESAGILRGKYPHLKTVDAVQIATALDAEAEAFLTNDKKLAGIREIDLRIADVLYLVRNVSYEECASRGEKVISPSVSKIMFAIHSSLSLY